MTAMRKTNPLAIPCCLDPIETCYDVDKLPKWLTLRRRQILFARYLKRNPVQENLLLSMPDISTKRGQTRESK